MSSIGNKWQSKSVVRADVYQMKWGSLLFLIHLSRSYILEWGYLKPFLPVIEVGKERETAQAKKLIEDTSNINFSSSWPEDSLDFKKGWGVDGQCSVQATFIVEHITFATKIYLITKLFLRDSLKLLATLFIIVVQKCFQPLLFKIWFLKFSLLVFISIR